MLDYDRIDVNKTTGFFVSVLFVITSTSCDKFIKKC